jgi:Phospholipase_D-nuclease N-terminal
VSVGQFLVYMLVVFVWFGLISAWAFALVDLFRRHDLSGWAKAIWLSAILLLPLVGTLVYLVVRPKVDEYDLSPRLEAMAAERADRQDWRYAAPASSAEQLRVLADLADQGRISEQEFQVEKTHILGAPAEKLQGAQGSST